MAHPERPLAGIRGFGVCRGQRRRRRGKGRDACWLRPVGTVGKRKGQGGESRRQLEVVQMQRGLD